MWKNKMKNTSWKENEKREIEHFSALIDNQEDTWYGNKTVAGQRRIDIRLDLIRQILNPLSEQRILEVGCGHGLFTERLIRLGASVFPFDLCFPLISAANKRKGNHSLQYSVASAHLLPFKTNSMDFVVGNAILHHLNVQAALDECHRVLKPGGSLLFFEPNMVNPQNALSKNVPFLKKLFQESPEETAFFRWSIKKQIEEAGFINVRVTPFDFLYPLTPKPFIQLAEKIGKILEITPLIKEIAGSLILFGKKS